MDAGESELVYFLKDETKQRKYCYNYSLIISCLPSSSFTVELIQGQMPLKHISSILTIPLSFVLFRDDNTIHT